LCFAVIFTEPATAKFFFEDIKNSTYIGRTGYLLEPEFDGQFLSSDKKMPILLVTNKFYVDILMIPNVNINPKIIGPGETTFFTYQDMQVNIETTPSLGVCLWPHPHPSLGVCVCGPTPTHHWVCVGVAPHPHPSLGVCGCGLH
jgi:hypothetical protein